MNADTRRRCTHCGRFVSQRGTFTDTKIVAGAFVTTYLCDDCLENAQPDTNEGSYTRIRNQFDAEGRAA